MYLLRIMHCLIFIMDFVLRIMNYVLFIMYYRLSVICYFSCIADFEFVNCELWIVNSVLYISATMRGYIPAAKQFDKTLHAVAPRLL